MDKRISSSVSLVIILAIAIFITVFLWVSNYLDKKASQQAVGPLNKNALDQKNLSESLNKTDNKNITEAGFVVPYENPKFGISLEIPKDWENKYKAVETPNSASGGFDSEGGFISFQLITTDPSYIKQGNNYAEVFSILVYPVSNLPKLEKNCKVTGAEWLACEIVNNQMGKNEKYAFAFISATSVIDFPKDFTEEIFNRADKVSETFKTIPIREVSYWKLISGSPGDSCSTPTYEGEATIHGWYEWDYSYVEKEWVLKIFPADAEKLPAKNAYGEESYSHFSKSPVLRLADADAQLVRKLKAASKTKPVPLTVKGFSAYCEGAPNVSVEKGSAAFHIVGNDRDEHGCIGSAGYSWCEGKQKCLRTWEEKC
jgi:hypothetical protein